MTTQIHRHQVRYYRGFYYDTRVITSRGEGHLIARYVNICRRFTSPLINYKMSTPVREEAYYRYRPPAWW